MTNNFFQGIYDAFIRPPEIVTEIEARHTARLLSSFLVGAISILVAYQIFAVVFIPDYYFNPFDLVGYGFLGLAYGLSRTKWFRFSAWLMIAPIPLIILMSMIETADPDPMINFMYLVIALVLASIFFNLKGTLILSGLNLVLILILPLVAGYYFPDYASIIRPLIAYLITAVLVIIFLNHRNRVERDRQLELKNAYDITLEGWAKALELRDKETLGHSNRVTDYTIRLARVLGVPEEQIEHIRRGALLHDVGKMAISDTILTKDGPLSAEDWEILRQHPVIAYDMLKSINYLQPALDIPHYHHENWDGTGYPAGLAGEDIPFAARIFAVVDVWDALSSDRPYREAWAKEKVIEFLIEQKGKKFDPEIVEVFLALIGEG